MAERSAKEGLPRDPGPVPWPDVVRFLRQLSHDLRNHLNAAELQSVFLAEIAPDAEMKTEVKRLREMISTMATVLQKISTALTAPKPTLIRYPTAELLRDLQRKFEQDFSERKSAVQWKIEAGETVLEIDPQLIQAALFELLENAFRHSRGGGEMEIRARAEQERMVITLREPKSAAMAVEKELWGREPLHHIGHGRYGLGLHRVRGIVEAHGGEFHAQFEPESSALVSTIVLPVSRAEI